MSLVTATSFAIATFDSTAHAIAAEQVLIEKKYEHVVLPLPTAIAASCGLALRFLQEDIEDVRSILTEKSLDFKIYKGEKNNKKENYELV